MIRPGLPPWIEEGRFFSALGIWPGNTIAFDDVASAAGGPEVFIDSRATEGAWHKMIEFHRRAGDGRRRQAIATAMASFIEDSPTHGQWDVFAGDIVALVSGPKPSGGEAADVEAAVLE